jgi:uncharacterized protein (UPF0548 family)
VRVERLDPSVAAKLKDAPLTYSPEAAGSRPESDGYRLLRCQRVLHMGDLDAAADCLLGWQVHAGAGLHVAASADRAAVGEVVVLTFGARRLGIRAPCRVVEVLDGPDRRGFVYATLPGHPESGTESFVLERGGGGELVFTVEAVSRAASSLARLGGPLTRRVQSAITERYLRAADRC